ncbi:alpha-(1,3)-fucosyltransferase C-like [Artemia franciscana]|uniref:Fucosyltransferase n=1 Tax=Artemia franciscana TaxID=6661 RepID=A0AA88I449_ARTSF|nr:hypothetical protein QYM36_005327 [Artemia franciscana]
MRLYKVKRIFASFIIITILLTIQVLHKNTTNESSAYVDSLQKSVKFSESENVIDPEELLLSTEESFFPVTEELKAVSSGKREIYWPASLYLTILAYDPPPYLIWREGNKPFREARCQEYRCFFTTRHSLVKDMRFDSILFSPDKNLKYLPIFENRRRNQTFVYFNLIPPTFHSSFKNGKDFFNISMTYRSDSDIYLPLGKVVPKPSAPKSESFRERLIQSAGNSSTKYNKSKLIATASVCKNPYLIELQKIIEVDNFGDCGSKSFKLLYNADYSEFFNNMSNTYKFFLIPEIFACTHYVHMLVFEVLKYDLVPVIYASDVRKILPVHSYIDATNLSPQVLANKLKDIDKNDVAYRQYFWWKNHFNVKSFTESTRDAFCELCELLHRKRSSQIRDINQWQLGNEKCRKI